MKTTWRGRQSLPNNSQKLDGHLREESFYCGNITWYCLSDRTSHKTRFQTMVSNLSHSLMKNLTEHRMHLEGSKIPQMNLSNHSFQEMSLGENWLFGQENCFHEKTIQNCPFSLHKSGLHDFGRKTDPQNHWHQIHFWVLPENFGIKRQMSNMEDWWHRNWMHSASIFF